MESMLFRGLNCYYELTNQQSHNQCDGPLVSLGLDLAQWDHIFDLGGKTSIQNFYIHHGAQKI